MNHKDIVALLIVIPILALWVALLMKYAHVLALKRFTTYRRAYLVTLASYFASWFTGIVIVVLVGASTGGRKSVDDLALILVLAAWCMSSWIAGTLFTTRAGSAIGFASGLSINIYLFAIEIAQTALLGGIGMVVVGVGEQRVGLRVVGVVFAVLGVLGIRKLMSKYREAEATARNATEADD